MKVLIVGGGGREHAIAASMRKSSRLEKLYCVPGNAGIAQIAECEPSIGVMEFGQKGAGRLYTTPAPRAAAPGRRPAGG